VPLAIPDNSAQTIQAFSTRLRDQIELDTLSTELLAVADQTMHRRLGDLGGPHGGHGTGLQLILGDRPGEERPEAAIAVVGGRGLPASELVGDEQLDVLSLECPHS
jgi:hypothetical protein